jgi:hypothetical protein
VTFGATARRWTVGVVEIALVSLCCAAVIPAAGAAQPSVSQALASKPNPRAHPTSNTQPSAAFIAACRSMGQSTHDNDVCDRAALKDFAKVRHREGLRAVVLPRHFDEMSARVQLLTISNLERVDRGLRPILGLTAELNTLAKDGANHHTDPSFPSPFTGTAGSANWASVGNSVLLDDFYWMYDDGYGSFNGDCQTKHAAGCWGHRDSILLRMGTGRVMGAAATFGPGGASMTEEFIGGYQRLQHDPVLAPTWKTIAATIVRS